MTLSANLKRPVVFLDRDGTLNQEVGYIRDLEKLVLIDGAADAVKRLNQHGVAAVLVTNQTGAARGYYPEAHIQALNSRLVELLAGSGAHLDAVYYCPHFKDGKVSPLAIDCQCRKPAPGLVEFALSEHQDFDAGRAYVVGDKSTDVELARNCRMKGILVETGYGRDVLAGNYQWPVEPDYTAKSIGEAVEWILTDLNGL
jgi:D-glycero-D-manno-heptose 1,7-bisphosphate phosphatase